MANFEKELNMFKNTKRCPVHWIYLGDENAFQEFSRQIEENSIRFKILNLFDSKKSIVVFYATCIFR
jgi:hypothetical protein